MKKRITLISIIFIILSITIISSATYLGYMQKLVEENIYKNLEELTKQDASNIENKLKEDIRILNSICNEITSNNIKNVKEMFELYHRNAGKYKFTRMAIMQEDGTTITSDGEIVDLSEDIEYFLKNEDIQISRSRKSKVDMQEINIYSQKIKIEDTNFVIMLIVETQEYERLFSTSIYNGDSYEYIITKEGEIIANSANHENTKNIYEDLKNNVNLKSKTNVDKIRENIEENKNGQDSLKILENKYYISYTNINVSNWILLIITPENIIAKESKQILKTSLLISIIIVLGITCISLYIIISNIKKKKELYNLAYIDPITKLGNYYYLLKNGQKLLDNSQNIPKYVIILDIEKFKSFNKHYGHNVGNKLLIQIGKKLDKVLEKHNKVVCRLSNDIFGIVIQTNKEIEKILEEIWKNLSKISIEEEIYAIYPVIGVYKCKDNEEILNAIDKASIAHDTIIGNYNKKYAVFDEKIEDQILEEHQIEEIMEEALEKNEFEVYYQPKIDIKEEKMVSAEALVRWKREGKIISPAKFIPLFEKNRFILKLDLYIYKQVCKDLKRWQKSIKEIENLNVSINISKEHFGNLDFIEKYVEIAEKYKIDTNKIELEITESASINSDINLIEIMKKIKERGFKISLDDFGTGYSSLNMLQDMPIDVIKIDKSFIDKIEDKNEKIDLIKYIVKIAKELNVKTVAEGVENIKQIEYLKNIGCDIVQGYYYSKPLSKIEFEKYIHENNIYSD